MQWLCVSLEQMLRPCDARVSISTMQKVFMNQLEIDSHQITIIPEEISLHFGLYGIRLVVCC